VFWAFAAIVIVILLAITISNRGVVRIIGGVLLAACLAAGLAQRLGYTPSLDAPEQQRGRPTSPATAIEAMPLESIKIESPRLSGSGAPFELRGRVVNSSDTHRVNSLTVRIVRRDCYEGAIDPSGCVVIWQDQHWLRLAVLPGEEREFATSFYAHATVPRARGEIKDEILVVAATGEPVSP